MGGNIDGSFKDEALGVTFPTESDRGGTTGRSEDAEGVLRDDGAIYDASKETCSREIKSSTESGG